MDHNLIVIFNLLTFCFVLAAVDDTDTDKPSSSRPTTSKKIQKKIDKKDALLQFKIENQSDKEKNALLVD
jgi:hypothetical protein